MKLLSPVSHKKARIEIIPLIDIMFFLLACMMLISLNMVQMKGLKLNLPTSVAASPENRSDFVTLSVKKDGTIFIDKESIERAGLVNELKKRHAAKEDLRIYIQADTEATHGDVIAVLDRVRSAGIQKVAFQTKPDSSAGGIIEKSKGFPAPASVSGPLPRAAQTEQPGA